MNLGDIQVRRLFRAPILLALIAASALLAWLVTLRHWRADGGILQPGYNGTHPSLGMAEHGWAGVFTVAVPDGLDGGHRTALRVLLAQQTDPASPWVQGQNCAYVLRLYLAPGGAQSAGTGWNPRGRAPSFAYPTLLNTVCLDLTVRT